MVMGDEVTSWTLTKEEVFSVQTARGDEWSVRERVSQSVASGVAVEWWKRKRGDEVEEKL